MESLRVGESENRNFKAYKKNRKSESPRVRESMGRVIEKKKTGNLNEENSKTKNPSCRHSDSFIKQHSKHQAIGRFSETE